MVRRGVARRIGRSGHRSIANLTAVLFLEDLFAPQWCIMNRMASTKQIRRSVTLPSQIDKEIETIARKRRLSGNRVLVELVELGLEARKQKEKAFFELAQRFRHTND